MSDYILPVLARMVATKFGYEVKEMSGRYRFIKPDTPGAFGNYDDPFEAWVGAARQIIEDAEDEGREVLLKRFIA